MNHPVKPADNETSNNFDLTPLGLACFLGKAKIFHEIVELSSIVIKIFI